MLVYLLLIYASSFTFKGSLFLYVGFCLYFTFFLFPHNFPRISLLYNPRIVVWFFGNQLRFSFLFNINWFLYCSYLQIYTSNMVSLHQLSIDLLKKRSLSTKEHVDLCSLCSNGGDLISCDRDKCTRAFHLSEVLLSFYFLFYFKKLLCYLYYLRANRSIACSWLIMGFV